MGRATPADAASISAPPRFWQAAGPYHLGLPPAL